MDAAQLATGRCLLSDGIGHACGVLLLVGEDRRRDLEARIAGICAHYHIAPSELRDRLHVVYQAEIKNPGDYTLGKMVEDMATLNERMFDWLRQYPGLLALFIDPMLSWHRLVENDNAAMQLLCVALRGLAAQANIAVAFDDHVTKLAMFDPEAHVGNLAAMRGGSAIAADMRWAFTMAKLKPETALRYGIAEDDRKLYRRLDTLKVESVRIANGESVGVLTTVDGDQMRAVGQERREAAAKERRTLLADALGRMLQEKNPRSAAEAALWIVQNEARLFVGTKGAPQSDSTIRKKLPTVVGTGIDWKRGGCTMRIVVRMSGTGNGARYELDFEQRDMA